MYNILKQMQQDFSSEYERRLVNGFDQLLTILGMPVFRGVLGLTPPPEISSKNFFIDFS